MSPQLQPGLCFEWSDVVPERATVPRLYHDTPFCSDMPDVLATGFLVGMMELACLHGMLAYVDWPREQSLGTMVSFQHLAPTPPGMTSPFAATYWRSRDGACASGSRVGMKLKQCEGIHEPCLVDPERFEEKMARKTTEWRAAAPVSPE